MSTNRQPKRGEIWMVDFDPSKGSEIEKARNALVISSDSVGVLPLKLVAPITTWNESFKGKLWLVEIAPDANNGLKGLSAVDTLQIRSADVKRRFLHRIGRVSADKMEEITAAIAIVLEYQ